MSEDEVSTIRRNAVARAADFFHDPIVRRWGEVLSAQSFAPIVRTENAHAEIHTAEVTANGITIALRASDLGENIPEQMFVSWKSRTGTFFGRVEADRSGDLITAEVPHTRIGAIADGYVDFSLDLVFD